MMLSSESFKFKLLNFSKSLFLESWLLLIILFELVIFIFFLLSWWLYFTEFRSFFLGDTTYDLFLLDFRLKFGYGNGVFTPWELKLGWLLLIPFLLWLWCMLALIGIVLSESPKYEDEILRLYAYLVVFVFCRGS